MSKQFICTKPTLGVKISLQQMSKEYHLSLHIISGTHFRLSGRDGDMKKLMKSRGWKQMVNLNNIKLG